MVVKLGTGVVTQNGVELALGRLFALVEDIAMCRRGGLEVVLVSSGAVAMGMRQLGLAQRPTSLGLRQACAAVGQGRLIGLYTRAFGELGLTTAQVLLTADDLGDRDRALCLRTTLMRLLQLGTVPILNENDSVSVREIVDRSESLAEVPFGDNDGLSARVAVAVDADLLVLLTDVDGLHSANPALDPSARRIRDVHGIDDEVLERAAGSSATGTGGMRSKLEAARVAIEAGIVTLIASGSTPNVLRRSLEGADIGTVVWPATRRAARRRHIAVSARHRGALIVNAGAVAALGERKASLLPIGVIGVDGGFERGDVVEIRDESGRVHGRGLANYDASECRALAGRHSSEIVSILGYQGYDALVTRDNLVLGEV